MSSDSESDEQFESADEDFDFDTDNQKHAMPNNSNDKILPELADLKLSSQPSVEQSIDARNKTESCESSDSKTQTFTKFRENDNINEKNPKNETSPSQSNKESIVQNSSNETSFLKEKGKIKNSEVHNEIPESGKVEPVNLIPNLNEKSEKSKSPFNPVKENTTVSKLEEASIGGDCDGWDVDSDDEINKALPKTLCFGNITKSEDNTIRSKETTYGNKGDNSGSLFSSHVASDKSQMKDLGSHKTNVQNENLIENASKDSGVDGWDVEVEDGFEIPVDLNKSSNHATGGSERFPFSLTNPLQKIVDVKDDSWGGWGSWGGVGNILSTASSGVTTLTSQVSHGFSHVLGAPDPAELAKLDRDLSEQRHHLQHNAQQSAQEVSQDTQNTPSNAGESPDHMTTNAAPGQGGPFSFTETAPSGLFSLFQLTRLVETTGSKVIAGGLDTLENLGKKTMEVLQEGDPGLKRKRALLFPNQDKPVLSQVLREAKGRLESKDKVSPVEERSSSVPSPIATKNLHFETLLDDYQGLAHLEALEILSKQCSLKLHTALMAKSGDEKQAQELNDFQETLQQIREMCQVEDASDPADTDEDDDDDEEVMGFGEKVEEIVRLYDLSSKLNCDRLIQVNKKMTLQIDRAPLESSCDALYAQCLRSMAEFTSVAMEMFHKSASLLLLKSKHRTVDESDALTQFTSLLCSRITALSSAHSQAMVQLDKDTPLVTSVYLEAANSCSYLQDASQLLVPVLQIVAIQSAS